MIKKCNYAKFEFEVHNPEKVTPRFSKESMRQWIASDRKFKLTILGAEQSTLLNIHQIVEYFECVLALKEDMEWEFVYSSLCCTHQMIAYVHFE